MDVNIIIKRKLALVVVVLVMLAGTFVYRMGHNDTKVLVEFDASYWA